MSVISYDKFSGEAALDLAAEALVAVCKGRGAVVVRDEISLDRSAIRDGRAYWVRKRTRRIEVTLEEEY